MVLTVLVAPWECSLSNLERLKDALSARPGPDAVRLRLAGESGVRRLLVGMYVDAPEAAKVLRAAGWVVGAKEE